MKEIKWANVMPEKYEITTHDECVGRRFLEMFTNEANKDDVVRSSIKITHNTKNKKTEIVGLIWRK